MVSFSRRLAFVLPISCGNRDCVTSEAWKIKLPFRLTLNKAASDKLLRIVFFFFFFEHVLGQARRGGLLATCRPNFFLAPFNDQQLNRALALRSPPISGGLRRSPCLLSIVLADCTFPRLTVDITLVMVKPSLPRPSPGEGFVCILQRVWICGWRVPDQNPQRHRKCRLFSALALTSRIFSNIPCTSLSLNVRDMLFVTHFARFRLKGSVGLA